MLACVIPGYLLLLLTKLLFAPDVLRIDDVSITIATFTFSYLIGLLFKWLMEIVMNNVLRNSPNRIRRAYNESSCIFEKTHLPDNETGLMKKYYIAYYKALSNS